MEQPRNFVQEAASKLGIVSSQLTREALADTLVSGVSSEEGSVRDACALALGAIGDPATIPALERACNEDAPQTAKVSIQAALVVLHHIQRCPDFDELSRRRMLEDVLSGRPEGH